MRIGFIGTGAVVRRHVLALRSLTFETVVACHLATTQAKADAAAVEWGGTGHSDLADFLRRGRPDAVFVLVPPHRHGAIERALIDAAIPFLVEKPLSGDRRTAFEIAALLHGRGLVTAVGYNWRALEILPRIRRLLDERGAHLIRARYVAGMPTKDWWRRQAESGGQIVEQACHVIDLARYLTGAARVIGAMPSFRTMPAPSDTDVAVATAALLEFGGGIPGLLEVSCVAPQLQDASVLVMGDGWSAGITLAETVLDIDGQRTTSPQIDNVYAVQANAFLSAMQSGRADDVLCSYADALATHAVCHDINDWRGHAEA
jgi:myo-inositol 2-dehydrogenase/D-chiro-inositol 1-dehydrogenase